MALTHTNRPGHLGGDGDFAQLLLETTVEALWAIATAACTGFASADAAVRIAASR